MLPVVLVVGDDTSVLEPVVGEIAARIDWVEPLRVSLADSVEMASRLIAAERIVPLIVIGDEVLTRDPTATMLTDLCQVAGEAPRVLLVTDRNDIDGLDAAFSSGHLQGVVTTTWTPGEFARHLSAQIRRGLGGNAPEAASPLRSPALEALEAPEPVIVQLLLEAIERPLGPRPRLRLGPGTVLVREGEQVNGVFLVVSGEIKLSRRTTHGAQILHRNSAGGVVGLLSFTQQRAAFVTAVAGEDVVAVHLTLEQLDQAMRHDAEVGTLFSALLLRALAKRLVRADELHLEVRELNRSLEQATTQLVDSARMATLGELSAGIAHELNNPVGALSRATDHLAADVAALLPAPDRAVLEAAIGAPPTSTADERRLRRDLAEALGDRGLADRLVRAGVSDPAEARTLVATGDDAVERRIRLHQLGTSVRNASSAGDRIAGLVSGLRSYVRGDEQSETEAVDVREGLDDTLRLLGHRLSGITVERRYPDALAAVQGRPGELNQVWTNLLANAGDALEGSGTVQVIVDQPAADEVRVRIVDDGPGIDQATAAKLFEPRFTTKGGRIEYGLGLGLTIAKRIVDAHSGTISIGSHDGQTTAKVILPVSRGPVGVDNREER